MIITITGDAGSGKSTAAKLLAKKLNMKHYSNGDIMRQMAKEQGYKSLLEFSKHAENNPKIDHALDERQRFLGETEDEFVIDSRLGWHFIPHSKKVFLKVDINEAARRIHEARREEESFKDIKSTIAALKERRNSETKRYMKLYRIDYDDIHNYDIVVDTTNRVPDEVVDEIIEHLHEA